MRARWGGIALDDCIGGGGGNRTRVRDETAEASTSVARLLFLAAAGRTRTACCGQPLSAFASRPRGKGEPASRSR